MAKGWYRKYLQIEQEKSELERLLVRVIEDRDHYQRLFQISHKEVQERGDMLDEATTLIEQLREENNHAS